MARKLAEKGIHAAILHEGWPAWKDAGYPAKEGDAAVKAAAPSRGALGARGSGWAAVFLYASLDKIAQPREFARIVYHYQVSGPSARARASCPRTCSR